MLHNRIVQLFDANLETVDEFVEYIKPRMPAGMLLVMLNASVSFQTLSLFRCSSTRLLVQIDKTIRYFLLISFN